ncbi:3-phosphoshikimate 1-carboxyvinyltransferase [soil metagenome]
MAVEPVSAAHDARAFLDLAPTRRLRGELRLPGSKSISNRVLLLAALSAGTTRITGLLESDDTAVMIDSLRLLGASIEAEAGELDDEPVTRITGDPEHFARTSRQLFVGNSGLTIRTLVPIIVAALDGFDSSAIEIGLAGVARMHERPIGDLVDGLTAIGAQIRYADRPGSPTLVIGGSASTPALRHELQIKGSTSSQFLTGLLQAAPLLAMQGDVVIEVVGELISRPYVDITIGLLERFGVVVERLDGHRYRIARGSPLRSPGDITVEGDASSASYFLAAGAIAGGPVRVVGAGSRSVQGDVAFADMLERMGANIERGDDWIESRASSGGLRGIDADCNAIPDAAMTLAVVAAFAVGPTTLRNIGSWRVKETDRIAAMSAELTRLGVGVASGDDWLRIEPAALRADAQIRTYDDHRIAMCFSLASLGPHGVPVRILEPGCVAKTVPDYFDRLAGLSA